MTKPFVICIMGPTASGKTSLAIELAKQLNGEVISVDSALVYRDMNIGTAKPNLAEQDGVVHHLIDIISPEDIYSVADFIKDAKRCIEQVIQANKLPILTGGTMMYFNALVNGMNELPAADPTIRQQIASLSADELCERLKAIDPVSAARIHTSDHQRLSRALEVYMASGKSLTHWQTKEKSRLPYNFLQFSIMPEQRSTLHENIEHRFDEMLAQGFVDELVELNKKYKLHADLPSMRSVGYRQVFEYLNKQLSYEKMRERGIIATRQLAKRQVTWLRSWEGLTNLKSGDIENVKLILQKVGATQDTIM